MVIKLDERLMDFFLPLIPETMRSCLEEDDVFCLGSLRDETAVGVLVFTVREGLHTSGVPFAMIEIQWIGTAEDYEGREVASELLDALSDIVEDIPDSVMVCDIPVEDRYDQAEEFFVARGFEFEEDDIPTMRITKEDCRTQSRYAETQHILKPDVLKNKPKGLVPLREVPAVTFRKAIKKMLRDNSFRYFKNLSEERDAYDLSTSFVIMHDGEISSVMLFRRTRPDELHMVMLDAVKGSNPKEMLNLLNYAAAYYFLKEPESTVIKLMLSEEKSKNLAVYIFPYKEMTMIRRGYRR